MNFQEFQAILSSERLQRYLTACDNDTRKTMTLYRLNLNLSQEVFTLLSCFEVAIRNAINRILIERLGEDWLRDSIMTGGIFDTPSCRTVQISFEKPTIASKGTKITAIPNYWQKWSSAYGNICLPTRNIVPLAGLCLPFFLTNLVLLPDANTTIPIYSIN